MNVRERQPDHYDPRPAYPPPPGTKAQKEQSAPIKIDGKYPPTKRKFYIILFFIAFGLLLLSGILSGTVGYLEEPDIEDYRDKDNQYMWAGDTQEEQDASEQAYKDDVESYEDSDRNLKATKTLFMSCGFIVLTFGLVIGAFTDKSLSKRTKLGMLITAGIIITFAFGATIRIN